MPLRGGFSPSAVVLVATVRALKYNGGVPKAETGVPNPDALKRGLVNLAAHVENMQKFGVPVVVAINRFAADSDEELAILADYCKQAGCRFALSEVFAKGGEGGMELARAVVEACEDPSDFHPLYDTALPIKEKIEAIATRIYGAAAVSYSAGGRKDDPGDRGARQGRPAHLRGKDAVFPLGRPGEARAAAGLHSQRQGDPPVGGGGLHRGAHGDIMTMPGLPKAPAAYQIDVDADGHISGLF